MYDVIICGCGTAGGYLAGLLGGLDVLVLEKEKDVVLKDSGLVSSHFKEFFRAPLIKAKIREMRAISPSGVTFSLSTEKPFAYLLKRKKFSSYLRRFARKNADVKYESVRKVSYGKDCVNVITEGGEYKASLVVGCDGVFSIVRRVVGIKPPSIRPAVFVRTRKNLRTKQIDIYLNKYYSPDFFSWVIPQTNEYGVITSIRPMEHLNYFKHKLSLPEGRIHSGYIPIGYCKSYAYRTLLVGDACGHTKPLSGGGIMFSLRAAMHASSAVKSAIEKEKFDKEFLSAYERMWKNELAGEIKMQLAARKLYRKFTNRDIDEMFVKFGYSISHVRDFDYDKLSSIVKGLPKFELVKYFLPRINLLFN